MILKIKKINLFILISFLYTINIKPEYNQKTGTQYIATLIGSGKKFYNWDAFINYLKEIPQEMENLRKDVAQIDGLQAEITRLQGQVATIQVDLDTTRTQNEELQQRLLAPITENDAREIMKEELNSMQERITKSNLKAFNTQIENDHLLEKNSRLLEENNRLLEEIKRIRSIQEKESKERKKILEGFGIFFKKD